VSTTSKVWEHIGGASVGVYDSDRHLALAAGDDDPTACRCRCGQPFTFNHALGARGAYECSAGHVAWRAVDGALLYERCTCGERMEYTVSVPPLGSALRKLRCPKCEPVKAGKLEALVGATATSAAYVDDATAIKEFMRKRTERLDATTSPLSQGLTRAMDQLSEMAERANRERRDRTQSVGHWGVIVKPDGWRCDCGRGVLRGERAFLRPTGRGSCATAHCPACVRAMNLATARAAEATPPNVRGLLSFGQRRGPAWERFRVALAGEVERCNCRPEPEVLTSARIEAIAREVVSRD